MKIRNKKILFLNFSDLSLSENIVQQIKDSVDIEVDKTINIDVCINMKGNQYQQIVFLLEPYHETIKQYEYVLILPPSLNIAAIYIIIEIYAITNSFPFILELEKDNSKGWSMKNSFNFKRIRSLATEILMTKRKNK